MSMRIAEIKAFDNPKMLERYIKKDERIMYQMAQDMMRDNSRLVALSVDSSDSFGVGLYNVDTKESLITALSKWRNSNPEDTRKTNLLISNVFHDVSTSADLSISMYDVNEIEENIKKIVENNQNVIEDNVSVDGIEMSPILTDEEAVVFDHSMAVLTTGSLFDTDLIREDMDFVSLDDLKEIIDNTKEASFDFDKLEQYEAIPVVDGNKTVSNEGKMVTNGIRQIIDMDESPSSPSI